MPPVSLRDLPIADVFEESIDRFGEELKGLLDPRRKTPTFLLKMQDDILSVKKQNRDIKPPFFTYRLGDVAINEEGLPAERLYRRGVLYGGPKADIDPGTGRPRDPNAPYQGLHAIPVNLNISVEYNCSFKEQLRFSQLWLFLAVKRFMLFELECAGTPLRIHADFDKNVTYSDVDFDNDSLVSCQTNAVMMTYIAKVQTVKPISTITAREKVLTRVDESDLAYKDGQRRRNFDQDVLIVTDSGIKRTPER